jgi:DNA polymerase I-like protein with 3'-5' exonuclease and polymerase domains
MSPGDWNWLLTIAGTVASIAGVVFSWMAWVQATKAKDAAREAAAAVRKRNTAQEFLRLAGDAKEFLSAVQQGRTENAISTANGLLHGLSMIRTQSLTHASDAHNLKECESEIIKVSIGLSADGIPIDQSRFADLHDRCHAIHQTICELAGRMERLSEGAVL